MRSLVRPYWVLLGVLALVSSVAVLDQLFPPPLARTAEVSHVVRDRNGVVLRAFPVEEGRWRLPADLDSIDPDFVQALLAYEDERFYSHAGVDMLAMLRATRDNLVSGRIVSGASTLTMQLARLIEPRERTLAAKLLQMIRAVQIERRLSKDEILEAYLTLAPYGGNLEGVRSASWAYFGREPDELTIDQIALLIALPQSPESRRPDRRPQQAVAARGRVLDRLASIGLASSQAARDAALDPAPDRRAFPALAWHASEGLVREQGVHAGGLDLVSTLDFSLQTALETAIVEELPGGDEDSQLAVLVVENETRAVRAALGSASRSRPGGWIDLTDRARSPGSTLKPFIYGMAFDDGLAVAQTRIADLPTRFAGYQPDNFDRTFRGDVTIAEALQHSLNVPAVATLDGVGARRFSAVLGFAGAAPSRRRTAGHDDGLAVALGGAGLSVRELAVLYSALADEGVAQPLRWLADAPTAEGGFSVLSAESAVEIVDILRRAPHPGGRMPASLTRAAPDIAFKTGTSYGFRDAWAAGVSGRYTIIVWSGRADGAPRSGLTGRAAALPVLFRMFDLVEQFDPSPASLRLAERETVDAPPTLERFAADAAPHILFPPDGAEVWADRAGRGFVLAAQSSQAVTWYADGQPVERNAVGDAVWVPGARGFYEIEAVDMQGRATRSRVRIHGTGEAAPRGPGG
ncbi:MAG: penicillin-binding protein 1C [Oceanicaulis sp.]|jgi:penicillin-binding protein 1C|nr:penicillin-binding protein 1C [Oceanicaulis sp.]